MTFERFIKERVGIEIPKTRISFLKKKREAELRGEWEYVYLAYLKLISTYDEKKREWEMIDRKLGQDYGRKMPKFPGPDYGTLKLPKNDASAYTVISNTMYQIASIDAIEVSEGLREEAIEKWWNEEIIADIPDCRLIVVKNEEYHPSEEAVARFEKAVKNNKPSQISFMGMLQWIAVNPDDWLAEFYLKNSCISIRNARVTYHK